jgi:hypothetical protein
MASELAGLKTDRQKQQDTIETLQREILSLKNYQTEQSKANVTTKTSLTSVEERTKLLEMASKGSNNQHSEQDNQSPSTQGTVFSRRGS